MQGQMFLTLSQEFCNSCYNVCQSSRAFYFVQKNTHKKMSCEQDITNVQNKIRKDGVLSLYGMKSQHGHAPSCGGRLKWISFNVHLKDLNGTCQLTTFGRSSGCQLQNGDFVNCR